MPSYNGTPGVTVGVTILDVARSVYAARATAGITEVLPGCYDLPHPAPGTMLGFFWDEGIGVQGASEWVAYDGASTPAEVLSAFESVGVIPPRIHVSGYTRSLVDPATHTAEGMLDALPDGTLVNVYREGTSAEGHVGNSGRLLFRKSLDNGGTWSASSVVYDDAYDDRNVAGGVIGSRIVVLFRRYNAPATAIDIRCTFSDDAGATWSAPTLVIDLAAANDAGSCFGRIQAVPTLGYVIPYYTTQRAGVVNYSVGYLTSLDGETWTLVWVLEATTGSYLCEPAMAYGDGLWVMACRRNTTGNGLTFLVSDDLGASWSSPLEATAVPSYWSTGGNLLFVGGRFVLVATDRRTYAINQTGTDNGDAGATWVYTSTAARLAASVSDWTLEGTMVNPCYPASGRFYGYPVSVMLPNGSLFCIVSDITSLALSVGEDADLYSFIAGGVVGPAATGVTLSAAYDAAKTAARPGDTMVPSVLPLDAAQTQAAAEVAIAASKTIPAGYVRVDTLAYGPLLPGTVVDAYDSTDTDRSTPLVDNVTVGVSGGAFIDLPESRTLTLVGRYPGQHDTIQVVTT